MAQAFQTLGFSFTVWVVNIVGFLLFFAFMAKKVWPLLSDVVEGRRQKILAQQREAEEKLAEAGKALDDARAKAIELVKTAEGRADETIRDASAEAGKIRDAAREEAASMKRTARAEADQMHDEALKAVKTQTARIAGDMAGRLLSDALDADRQKALLDAALADVEAMVGKEERN